MWSSHRGYPRQLEHITYHTRCYAPIVHPQFARLMSDEHFRYSIWYDFSPTANATYPIIYVILHIAAAEWCAELMMASGDSTLHRHQPSLCITNGYMHINMFCSMLLCCCYLFVCLFVVVVAWLLLSIYLHIFRIYVQVQCIGVAVWPAESCLRFTLCAGCAWETKWQAPYAYIFMLCISCTYKSALYQNVSVRADIYTMYNKHADRRFYL